MEELDLVELDQNDSDYYLTEKGYDCIEAGVLNSSIKPSKVIPFDEWVAFQKSPKKLKVMAYLFLIGIAIVGRLE